MRRIPTIPDFTIEGVTFGCWADETGSFVWRSACGGAETGREGRAYWARVAGRTLGAGFVSLRLAMRQAARGLNAGREAA